MEIKNKKMMFVLILVVLALVSAFVVEAQLGFRFRESNIRMYFSGKMLVNYIIIFSILFIIVYFVAFKEDKRPKGVLLGFFIAALFALSVALAIFITKGEPNFIWEISKLENIQWLFKSKTIVNTLIVIAICVLVKTFLLGKYSEKKESNMGIWLIIILISLLVVYNINYDQKTQEYKDRWIWEYPQVNRIKLFLFGDQPDGSYTHSETGELKQGVLTFANPTKGFWPFLIGSLLLIWLFVHFDIFKDSKYFQYGVPILLAALLANEGYTKESVMGYAWWTALIIINRSFKNKDWGKDRPGLAFGLAFAIVQTVYVAVVGEAYIMGTTSFLWNFVLGIGLGFIWDLLLGQGGIWEAHAARAEAMKRRISGMWEREGAVNALRYGLGRVASALPWVRDLPGLRRWLIAIMPLEARLRPMLERARRTLEVLIKAERARRRNPARIARLRTSFDSQMRAIRALNIRITRLRSFGGP